MYVKREHTNKLNTEELATRDLQCNCIVLYQLNKNNCNLVCYTFTKNYLLKNAEYLNML